MKVRVFSCFAVLAHAAALVPLVASLASSSPTPQAVPFKHNARTLLASSKRFGRELVKTSPYDPAIRQIALPAFATLALDPLMSMVDAAFVGHLGAAQLGGVGIAGTVLRFTVSMFAFLVASVTPIVAGTVADNDTEATSRAISGSLTVGFAGGVLLSLLLLQFAPQLVTLCSGGAPVTSHLHQHAVIYLRIRLLALPAVVLSFASAGAYRGFLDTRTPLAISIIANLVNVVGDYYFINFAMGVAGAAWATTLSQFATAIGLTVALIAKKRLRVEHMFRVPAVPLLQKIMAGSVLGVRSIAILSTLTLAASMASSLGAVAAASYEICRQVWMFAAMSLDALAVAAQCMVAAALKTEAKATAQSSSDTATTSLTGASNGGISNSRALCNRLLQLGLLYSTSLGIAIALGRHVIPVVFTTDAAVRACTAALLPIIALFEPVCGLVFVFDGVYAAAEDYKYVAAGVAAAGAIGCFALWCAKTALPHSLHAVVWAAQVLMLGRAAVLGYRYLSHKGPIPPEQYSSSVTTL